MEKAQKAKKVLFRAYSAFDRSKLLNSIRKGFIMLIPIFTVGGFALMLMNVPIPAVKNWIESVWGGAIFNVFTFVYEATFGLMAIYILLAISYRYSQEIFGESDTLNSCSHCIRSELFRAPRHQARGRRGQRAENGCSEVP